MALQSYIWFSRHYTLDRIAGDGERECHSSEDGDYVRILPILSESNQAKVIALKEC